MFQKRIILIFFIILSFLGGALPAAAALDYNIKNDTTSFLFVSGTSGNVGIATTIPVGKLEVRGGTAAPSKIVHINGTFADLGGTRTGLYVDVTADQVGAGGPAGSWSEVRTTANAGTYTNAITGSFSESLHSGNATADHLIGAMTLANQYGSGAVTNAYGIYPQVWKGAGTITNAYGVYFPGVPSVNGDTGSSAGTVTNQYGMAINKLTQGTSRNIGILLDDAVYGAAATGNFGIYQESGDANYFTGNVGIGTTVMPGQLTLYSPNAMLVDSRTNANENGTQAIESRYFVGTASGTRTTPSDVNNFRFFAGFGGFQEVVNISINTPQTLSGNGIGAVDFKTQGSDGVLTPRMTVNEQGVLFPQNVGVGTTNPGTNLEVKGRLSIYPTGTTPEYDWNGDLVISKVATGQMINLINPGNITWSIGMVYDSGIFAIGTGRTSKSTFVNPEFAITEAGNIGIGTILPLARLAIGAGIPNAMSITGNDLYVKGNIELDGKIYGDGSGLTGVSGAISGLNTGYIPQANSSTTIVDSAIYQNGSNVGIGTTNPLAQLSVYGDVFLGSYPAYSQVRRFKIYDNGVDGAARIALIATGSNSLGPSLEFVYDGNVSRRGLIRFDNFGANNYGLSFFDTVSGTVTQSMVLNHGNIGIGTTTPAASLQVGVNPTIVAGSSPAAAIKGNLVVDGKIYGDGSALSGLTSSQWTTLGSNIYYNTGNVGIGTTSTSAKFLIVGNTYTTEFDTTSNGAYAIRTDGPIRLEEGIYSGSTIKFYDTNGIPLMSVLQNGNIGIGTTLPPAALALGAGTPNAMSITGSDAYIKGNLEVDGKIYGDGSALTGISGAVSGLTATRLPLASSSTTLVDSSIYEVGGNIGIGTTNPESKVVMKATQKVEFLTSSQGSYSVRASGPAKFTDYYFYDVVGFIRSSAGVNLINFDASNNIIFLSNKIYVNATTGNVGIGTTVPLAKLAVVGTGTTTARAFEIDDNLYNPKVVVLDNGKVGIGSTSPDFTLQITGGSSYSSHLGTGGIALTDNIDTAQKMYMGYDPTLYAGFIQSAWSNSSWLSTLINPAGGKVGIGTAMTSTLKATSNSTARSTATGRG